MGFVPISRGNKAAANLRPRYSVPMFSLRIYRSVLRKVRNFPSKSTTGHVTWALHMGGRLAQKRGAHEKTDQALRIFCCFVTFPGPGGQHGSAAFSVVAEGSSQPLYLAVYIYGSPNDPLYILARYFGSADCCSHEPAASEGHW